MKRGSQCLLLGARSLRPAERSLAAHSPEPSSHDPHIARTGLESLRPNGTPDTSLARDAGFPCCPNRVLSRSKAETDTPKACPKGERKQVNGRLMRGGAQGSVPARFSISFPSALIPSRRLHPQSSHPHRLSNFAVFRAFSRLISFSPLKVASTHPSAR
jgi:hypothetical protein